VVHPVGLVAKAGVWYLVACRDGEPRTYRSGRIEHAELRGPVSLPPGLPPLAELWVTMRAAYERPGTGVAVEVRAPHDVTRYLVEGTSAEVVAEPTRRRDPDRDGHDLVTLTFRSVRHARALLLGHYDRIEIVSPDELIAEFAAAGRALAERYG
jgi:predicted DNA-binding transcriptional regulator YafY